MALPIQRAHLDGLVVFVAVAELRGFRAAARQLGVTPSAISQTIRALEQRVGAPLLSRTTRSVGLTEAGERLLVHARPAMEMLSLGLDAAASLGDDVSGRLRINLARAVLPLLANRCCRIFSKLILMSSWSSAVTTTSSILSSKVSMPESEWRGWFRRIWSPYH